MKLKTLLLSTLIIMLVLSACTPKTAETPTSVVPAASPTTEPPAATPTSEPPPPTTEPVDELLVNSWERVEEATIQIIAQGSFIDPEFGQMLNAFGSGTGFFIHPSGIAVTNNHVVTGAALLQVYVKGEDRPRNAKILGVSECWDLAVIDVDGDGFSYLEVFDGEVKAGMDVYAAGFPLGDPEYTLTRGIVSKARANGESSWASIDYVIEHDARIRGGNSGGPLVNPAGQLVGINYAGISSTDQNFAILAKDTGSVIETLRNGDDFESIGINGQAVASEDGSLTGIWVGSVKSGSPADKAGIQGGDILTRMEGLVLSIYGDMSEYCDILRTRSPEDTFAIEVLRYATSEYLSGQINGRPLELDFSFAQELEGQVDPGSSGGSTGYSDYVTVMDDYQSIQIVIPVEWGEVDGAAWEIDGDVIGAQITAASNLNYFNAYWDEPGVFFGVTDDIAQYGGYVEFLDIYRDVFSGSCDLDSRFDYEDSGFEGQYDLYTGCDGENNTLIVLSARPKNDQTAFLTIVIVNLMTDADLEALDNILNSFDVVGALP